MEQPKQVNNMYIAWNEEKQAYILQLNMEYYLISEQLFDVLSNVPKMSKDMGISVG